jgi:chemotaxis signal transduction protein
MTRLSCYKTIGVFGDGTCSRLPGLVHCRNCAEYARAGRQLFDRPLAQGELEQWAELFSREKEAEPADTFSVVIFRVGREWFALKTAFFQEVTDLRPVHTVPYRSGAVFKGIANINGELLLCIDPAPVLTPGAVSADCRRMMVTQKDGSRFALMVEEILGVRRIEPGAVSLPPATVAKSPAAITAGIFSIDVATVGLLDETALFESLAGSISP